MSGDRHDECRWESASWCVEGALCVGVSGKNFPFFLIVSALGSIYHLFFFPFSLFILVQVGVTTVNSNTFLPQCRRRVYFVAVKDSETHFPSHPLFPSLHRQLKAVLEPDPDPSHQLTNTRVLATVTLVCFQATPSSQERKMHRYLARKERRPAKPDKANETAKGGAEHWIRTWEEVGCCRKQS